MDENDLKKLPKDKLIELIYQLNDSNSDLQETAENNSQSLNGSSNPQSSNSSDMFGEPVLEGDNSRWELETDDVIDKIEHALRREKKSRDGLRWVKIPQTEPLMNERGIATVISTLKGYLNKNNALGNIKEQDVHWLTGEICNVTIDLIKYNWRNWDLQKPYFKYVITLIESQVYVFLTRPINAGERKDRKGRFRYNENYSHDEVSPDEISASPKKGFKIF